MDLKGKNNMLSGHKDLFFLFCSCSVKDSQGYTVTFQKLCFSTEITTCFCIVTYFNYCDRVKILQFHCMAMYLWKALNAAIADCKSTGHFSCCIYLHDQTDTCQTLWLGHSPAVTEQQNEYSSCFAENLWEARIA